MGKVDRSIDRDISAISQLVHVDVIRVTRINVLVDAFQDHTGRSVSGMESARLPVDELV